MSKDKKSLRLALRAKRNAINTVERENASRALVQQICTQDWFQQSHSFALYHAIAAEIDTKPLIAALWQQQKTCYLPKITPDNTLMFAQYKAETILISNRFGIAEPDDSAALCPINELDVIFIPLLAFDEHGHRLGMGAGFYDKTLASLNKQKKRPLLVGLAYEFQKVHHIPQDPWDINLDIIATEKRIYFK